MKEICELYENLRLICYRLGHIQSDFKNEFRPRSEIEKKLFNTIIENMETMLADTMNITNILYELGQAEDDADIEIILNNYLESEN